jgi:prepilin-type N-terminal cleavage/methylation domain-containing protein
MVKLNKNMKKQLSIIKQQGFTLIELLVVIGILGVLAAALIATIDPFEQLKKSQDASTKNTLVEFVDANIRFYATHNAMPWYDTASGGVSGCASTATAMSDASGMNCVNGLITDGELKNSFAQATTILQGIRYFGDAATPGVTACFAPISKSQQRDPNTIYNSSGASVGSASGTHWCAN